MKHFSVFAAIISHILLIGLSSSTDDTAVIDSFHNVGLFQSLIVSDEGTASILYKDLTSGILKIAICDSEVCGEPIIESLEELGNSWGSMILGPQGYPIIAFEDDNLVMDLAYCSDWFCTEQIIVPLEEAASSPSIVLSHDGYPIIAYTDYSTSDADSKLRLITCRDEFCTTYYRNELTELSSSGHSPVLQLSAEGFPIIAFTDWGRETVKVALCNDMACIDHRIIEVDSQWGSDEGVDMVIDQEGRPILSYYNLDSYEDMGSLRLAICDDTQCEHPSIRVMETELGRYALGDSIRMTSILLMPSGAPVVSYYDKVTGSLKIAACEDPSCATTRIYRVEDESDVGVHSSLAHLPNGGYALSYYDATLGDLKYVHLPEADLEGNDLSFIGIRATEDVVLPTREPPVPITHTAEPPTAVATIQNDIPVKATDIIENTAEPPNNQETTATSDSFSEKIDNKKVIILIAAILIASALLFINIRKKNTGV